MDDGENFEGLVASLESVTSIERSVAMHLLCELDLPEIPDLLKTYAKAEVDDWSFSLSLDCLLRKELLTPEFLVELYASLGTMGVRFCFWLFAVEEDCPVPTTLAEQALFDEWPVRVAATKFLRLKRPEFDPTGVMSGARKDLTTFKWHEDDGRRPLEFYDILIYPDLARSFISDLDGTWYGLEL